MAVNNPKIELTPDDSGRVCQKCGNNGTRGRIYAVLNEILPADYMNDIYVANCGCSACGHQWEEDHVLPRDVPLDYEDE